MRSGSFFGVFVALVISAACSSTVEGNDEPGATGLPSTPTVVVNAQVYTIDRESRSVDAFAYDQNGVILAVGSESEVRTVVGEDAVTIDADGNMVRRIDPR